MKNFVLMVLLISPFCFYAQFGEQQIIDDGLPGSWSIYVVDLDGDGYLDLLATEELNSEILWYKNLDGLGNFEDPQLITNTLEYTRYVAAADIDNDGDMDVIATSGSNDIVVWYENEDGLGDFSIQQVISSDLDLPKMVIAEDVDGDGDLDVLTASRLDNTLAWFENTNGLGNFGSKQVITSSALNVASVFYADINGDGIKDVICDSSSNGNGYPSWYENDGNGNFGTQQEITTNTSGSNYVLAEDVDDDGDMDVLNIEFGSDIIAWYENTDGQGTFGPKKIITDEIHASRKIFIADLDNDGDPDILYNSQEVIDSDYMAWRENDGHGNFGEEQVITTNVIAPRGIFAADVDNDGDMDVFSTSIADNKITWYENYTILGLEESLEIKISLHPNPANTHVNLTSNSNFIINSIVIYDVMGRQAKQEFENTNQIDISNLEAGVYFVTIRTDKGELVKKIIKE